MRSRRRKHRCIETALHVGEPRPCTKPQRGDLPVCYGHTRVWAQKMPREFLALRLGRVNGAGVRWVADTTITVQVVFAVERDPGPALDLDVEARSPMAAGGVNRGIVLTTDVFGAFVLSDWLETMGDDQSAAMLRRCAYRGREMTASMAAQIRDVLIRGGLSEREIAAAFADKE